MTITCDAIIIGTGQAGPFLARRLTTAGMKVAIIERKLFGGTCVNTGCIPTKTMVASAYAARIARRASDFGVSTGSVSIDMKRVKARKDEVSGQSRTGLEDWLKKMENCSRNALLGKRPMTRVGRAVEKGETQGFMKILVDRQTREILGAAILGTGDDEVIHSILDVMYAKAPYTVIQRAMHIHPTVSELIPTMLGELQPLSEIDAAKATH
jgi:pyruvate/2-oxoglutarate dehydrogenase complex dihydrolipoamide dehydrogenase (E3) component